LPVIAGGDVGVEPAAGLGGHIKWLRALAAQPGDELLAVAVPVNVGRVDKIDAEIEGMMQGGQRFPVVDVPPGAANGPRPKADGRDLPAGAAELAVFHGVASSWSWMVVRIVYTGCREMANNKRVNGSRRPQERESGEKGIRPLLRQKPDSF